MKTDMTAAALLEEVRRLRLRVMGLSTPQLDGGTAHAHP